jgi:hypothetical protein
MSENSDLEAKIGVLNPVTFEETDCRFPAAFELTHKTKCAPIND